MCAIRKVEKIIRRKGSGSRLSSTARLQNKLEREGSKGEQLLE